jgi:hypothetical protein
MDDGGHAAMPVGAMAAAGTATWRTGARGRRALRKGRGLPLGRPPGEIEFALQPFDFAPQALVLALDPFAVLPFPIAFSFGALRAFTPVTVALIDARLGHDPFMADSRGRYKYKLPKSSARERACDADPLTRYL